VQAESKKCLDRFIDLVPEQLARRKLWVRDTGLVAGVSLPIRCRGSSDEQRKGEVVMLPFQGQQIERGFPRRSIAVRSMFDSRL
jgi:hypothetical protein